MDRDGVARLLYEGFRVRGLNDPAVHKDEETLRLLGNYRAIVSALAGEYKARGSAEEVSRLHRWAEAHLPKAWETAYTAALDLEAVGRAGEAAEFMEKAGQAMLERVGQDPHANYDNLCAIADVLQGRYGAAVRAEPLYRRIALLKPERPEALYGLAATLQAQGRNKESLEVVEAYVARYGEQGRMGEARRLLRESLGQAATVDGQARP
jgi:thioredoxin-like negative regulator of GroEL